MRAAAIAVALLALAACTTDPGNRPPGERSADTKSWQAAQNGYVAPGWNPGDARSWEEHLRNRAQRQNEYTRVTP
jgi:hypothetical protein